MSLSNSSVYRVDNHWAVLAVGEAQRDRGLIVANARLAKKAVGEQIRIEFLENDADESLLRRLSMAYEMAAIEGMSSFLNPTSEKEDLREQCMAGASRAFELYRLFDLPVESSERIFHVLHLSALAYCGDRWPDLRRWFNERESDIHVSCPASSDWDIVMVHHLYDCWARLFTKKSWDDVDRIREIIGVLRADQKIHEPSVLDTGSPADDRAMALRLVGLYHWAKGTELLATYMLTGEPPDIATLLDKHFESAIDAASLGADARLEILMRWLHGSARKMVTGSIWWVARAVNSRVTRFVRELTKHQSMFELLPPQRIALQEQGLLDQAATALVVELPTSGGKTLLAEFKILQALNQFGADNGWIAYVAPTKALTGQITRRLRRDFEPIGIKVEQLTGAIEIDTFEEDLLTAHSSNGAFDVLVTTPEKLQLIIRNNKVPRPLVLVVMDEAHNIEDEARGLRIELLLATIKRDCSTANFLLLMPYVEKAETLARWLAHDVKAGRTISFGTTAWRPNERIVGMYQAAEDDSVKGGWRLTYQTLITTPGTIHLEGTHGVGGLKPLNVARSKANPTLQTAAMAAVLSDRGTSIAIALNITSVWKMARMVTEVLTPLSPIPEEVQLVQSFLRTEVSPDFELINLLAHGVGVHHSGLSDEVRALIEWLAEEGKLRILCATTTIAQGINFPVSSVFLASRFVPQRGSSKEMSSRDFWNLAGRAGRINHDSVGIVGLAAGSNPEKIMEYVSRSTGELVSRLVNLLDDLEQTGRLNQLEAIILDDQWDDFRCYIAHLLNQKKDIEAVLADTEQLLRNTLGYGVLRSSPSGTIKAEKLLEATKSYARRLADSPGVTELADVTGFSPEGVGRALAGLGKLDPKLTIADWAPANLFGKGSGMAELFGVMLRIPQLADSLTELAGKGYEKQRIADVAKAWVGGKTIQEIATEFFKDDEDGTKAITDATKAIYRNLVNAGTWGLSALSRLSGIDFEALPESDRRRINALPAMIYHGVGTEEAVLMRMNSVPRSIAERLGKEFRESLGEHPTEVGVRQVRDYIKSLDINAWTKARPDNAYMTGHDYKKVWHLLSGELREPS